MEEELDIRQVVQILTKRWKLIALIVILAVVSSAAYTHYTYVPKHKTTSTLIVMLRTDYARGDQQIYDVRLSREIVETIERFAQSRLVLDEVTDRLGYERDYERLLESIEINQYADTEILEITVTERDPVRAQDTANALAMVLVDKLVDYMQVNNVRLVDSADEAVLIPPRTLLNVTVALVLGLMAGVGLIFLREALDNTLKTPEDVQQVLGVPVLGAVRYFDARERKERG